jgi:hypothetical protein
VKKTIQLKYKKSTKGTHVYENEDFALSIYLPRALFDNPAAPPQILTFTIEG